MRGWIRVQLCLLVLVIASVCLQLILQQRCQVSGITMEDWESDAFRKQQINEKLITGLVETEEKIRIRILTTTMLMGHYEPQKLYDNSDLLLQYKAEEYKRMQSTYEAIWSDVQCFPVTDTVVSYADSWMMPRNYGGQRQHEGCDIFGEKDESGCYPIVSMTDGVVEKVGWLPLGGYRIGIRSPHGAYFYYAHLASYARVFREQEDVYAGEILGFMGNTGYGDEGTTGKFPVHLHLGIYIETGHFKELSINPYGILKFAQKL